MPCIDSTGKLSESGRRILAALAHPVTLEEAARQSGFPLYRVRSAARELVAAGLLEVHDGGYVMTTTGKSMVNVQD